MTGRPASVCRHASNCTRGISFVHFDFERKRQNPAALHADPHVGGPRDSVHNQHLVPVENHTAVRRLRQPPWPEDLELQPGQVDGEKCAHGAKIGQVLVEVEWTEVLRVLDLVASQCRPLSRPVRDAAPTARRRAMHPAPPPAAAA